MATKKPTREPLARRTAPWLLENEVLPRLKGLEEGQIKLTQGQTTLKQQVYEAGIGNGHAMLLKEFLEDQATRKINRDARDRVWANLKHGLRFLRQPRTILIRLVQVAIVAVISAYFSAVMFGKLPLPPPFGP